MKRLIIAALFLAPAMLLTSCTVTETTAYSPGYSSDYISVGYYGGGYQPYWDNYYSTGWGGTGYWRGYRGVYSNGLYGTVW